jgi:hypothetical protein
MGRSKQAQVVRGKNLQKVVSQGWLNEKTLLKRGGMTTITDSC